MAQLERKIGLGSGVDAGLGDPQMDIKDYEMASLDDSDFTSAIVGEQEHHESMHRVGHDAGLRSPVKFLLWFLLVVHMSGLIIWIRVWLRDRKMKAARTGKMTPPPQRQSCTYDVDSRFISKLELPLKALKLARA
jgi:hypothetical protein